MLDRKKRIRRLWVWWARWIHVYLSMFAFGALLFFSFTGLTLNHTDWFGAETSRTNEYRGSLAMDWLSQSDAQNPSAAAAGTEVKKLEISEFLRATHGLRGEVTNFSVDEYQCTLVYAGPGYSADVFVDRTTGEYEVTESLFGAFAIMNDLHKGRDSGLIWKLLIDVSAIVCVLVSLTGLWLLCYIRGRWRTGLMTGVGGCLTIWLIYLVFVP